MDRQTDGRTDRRVDGQIGGQVDGQTDGWIDRWVSRWMGGKMDGWTGGWTDRRMGRQTNGQTDGWTNGWTDRQAGKQMDQSMGEKLCLCVVCCVLCIVLVFIKMDFHCVDSSTAMCSLNGQELSNKTDLLQMLVPPAGSVVDLLSRDDRFSRLLQLLRTANLFDELASLGSLTFFAPTNEVLCLDYYIWR